MPRNKISCDLRDILWKSLIDSLKSSPRKLSTNIICRVLELRRIEGAVNDRVFIEGYVCGKLRPDRRRSSWEDSAGPDGSLDHNYVSHDGVEMSESSDDFSRLVSQAGVAEVGRHSVGQSAAYSLACFTSNPYGQDPRWMSSVCAC